MRYSILSTIPLEDAPYMGAHYTPVQRVFVPRGQPFTIVEMADGQSIEVGASHRIEGVQLVDARSGAATPLTNTLNMPCAFCAVVPARTRCGLYKVRFTVGGHAHETAAFRVTAHGNWVQFKGNNTNGLYSDGSPSVFSGRQLYYYHYMLKSSLTSVLKQSDAWYDDQRGKAFSLRDSNYIGWSASLIGHTYTADAVGILLSGGFCNMNFLNRGNRRYIDVRKVGEITKENNGEHAAALSFEFNAREVMNSLPVYDYDDNNEQGEQGDLEVLPKNAVRPIRMPAAAFTGRFYNGVWQDSRGRIIDFSILDKDIESITLHTGAIPDNFLRWCTEIPFNTIRHADRITSIGDNCKILTGDDFPALQSIGRNCFISGAVRVSREQPYDNTIVGEGSQLYAERPVVLNYRNENEIPRFIKPIAKFVGCRFYDDMDRLNAAEDAVFDSCYFSTLTGALPKRAVFRNCRAAILPGAERHTIDVSGFAGVFENSFRGQKILLDYGGKNGEYRVEGQSLTGWIEEKDTPTPYLTQLVPADGRSIAPPKSSPLYPTVNGSVLQRWGKGIGVKLDGEVVAVSSIESVSIPDGYGFSGGELSDINSAVPLDLREASSLGSDNLNGIICKEVKVSGMQLVEALQRGNFLNAADCTLSVDTSGIAEDFSYSAIVYNPLSFRDAEALTVVVYGASAESFAGALMACYKDVKIKAV